MPNQLPWTERINMLAVNPDAATRDDVAMLAAERNDLEILLRKVPMTRHETALGKLHTKECRRCQWFAAVDKALGDNKGIEVIP